MHGVNLILRNRINVGNQRNLPRPLHSINNQQPAVPNLLFQVLSSIKFHELDGGKFLLQIRQQLERQGIFLHKRVAENKNTELFAVRICCHYFPFHAGILLM